MDTSLGTPATTAERFVQPAMGHVLGAGAASFPQAAERYQAEAGNPGETGGSVLHSLLFLASARLFGGRLKAGRHTLDHLRARFRQEGEEVVRAADLLEASAWLLEGQPEKGLRLTRPPARPPGSDEGRALEALRLLLRARLLLAAGDDGAPAALEEAREHLFRAPSRPEILLLLADLYLLDGEVQLQAGHRERAASHFQQSLALARRLGHALGEARALLGLGEAEALPQRLEEATTRLLSASRLFESILHPWGIARAALALGGAFLAAKRLRDAEYTLEEALQLISGQGFAAEEADLSVALGEVLLKRGLYQAAQGSFQRALEHFQRESDAAGEARVLGYLGQIHRLEGRYLEAERALRKAARHHEETEDSVSLLRVLGPLCLCHLERGQREEARELVDRMMGLSPKPPWDGVALLMDGLVLRREGREGDAWGVLQGATRSLEEGSGFYHLMALLELAETCRSLERPDEEVEALKTTVEYARRLGLAEFEDRALERLAEADRQEWVRTVHSAILGTTTTERHSGRSYVSVLMADLRGYTSLSLEHDVEAVASLVNEFFNEMSEVVYRQGGVISKFMGDCVMAVFGLEHKVSPLDALACAQAMQASFARMARRNERILGVRTGMGVGLATGEAVVGMFGSRRRLEYTVIGPPVNLASRLQGLAAGGEILVCPTSARALGNRLDDCPVRDLDVKGYKEKLAIRVASAAVPALDARPTR